MSVVMSLTRVNVTSEPPSGYDTPIPENRISEETLRTLNAVSIKLGHDLNTTHRLSPNPQLCLALKIQIFWITLSSKLKQYNQVSYQRIPGSKVTLGIQ